MTSAEIQMYRFDDDVELSIELHEADGFRVRASGLARALGIRDAANLLRSIPEAEQGYSLVSTPGGKQRVGYLTEAGFYRALGQRQASRVSDPAIRGRVERFQAWVFGTVLPEIRRTGSFNTQPALPDRRALAQMVIEAEDRADAERAARLEAESHARELEAPASAWQHMASSAGDYAMADAAKILSRDPSINIGRNRLFDWMRAEGWVFRTQGFRPSWRAYQTQIDNGRLAEKMGKPFLNERTGEMELPAPTIRVTPKGLAALHKKLGGSGPLQIMAEAAS
jgi:prophage antirepressor-like protein